MFQPNLTWWENHFPICIKGNNLCKVTIMLFKPQNSSEDPVIHWGCLCFQELQVQQGLCWYFILTCCKAHGRETHLLIMPKCLKYLQLLSVHHLGLLLAFYLVSPCFVAPFWIKPGFQLSPGKFLSTDPPVSATSTSRWGWGMMGMGMMNPSFSTVRLQPVICLLQLMEENISFPIVAGEHPAAEMVGLHLSCTRLTRLDTEPGRCLTLWPP